MYKVIVTSLLMVCTIIIYNTFSAEEKNLKTVDIAILDSGINSDNLTYQYDTFTDEEQTEDEFNHGTGIYNILMDNKPDAQSVNVYDIKVLDDNGKGSNVSICKGVDKAVELDVDLITMSFGFQEKQEELEKCLNMAERESILLVAASGDTLSDSTNYPAAYDNVISVSALNEEEDDLYSFSSTGKIDFLSPGEGIETMDNKHTPITLEGSSFAAINFVSRYISYYEEGLNFEELDTSEMKTRDIDISNDRSISVLKYN